MKRGPMELLRLWVAWYEDYGSKGAGAKAAIWIYGDSVEALREKEKADYEKR